MMTIETTIELTASPEEVWVELMDFESYSEWNPFIPSIEGRPLEGNRLRVRIDPPEGRGMTFKPRVTALIPGERLEWLGRLLVPGLFDGRHEFRLEEVAPGRTRFVQRESFSGLLVGVLLDADAIREGFEAMNEALRVRIEGSAGTEPTVETDDTPVQGGTA